MSDALDRLTRMRYALQRVIPLTSYSPAFSKLLKRLDEELDMIQVDLRFEEMQRQEGKA